MKLRYARLASADLDAVYRFISLDNPSAAAATIIKIDQAILGLQDFPRRGRPARVDGTRELVVAGTPFAVAYQIQGDEIQILAIMHGARAWPSSF